MSSHERHPRPEEVLAWASGRFQGTSREGEIEDHLAGCASPCGQYASLCLSAAEVVLSDEAELGHETDGLAEVARVRGLAHARREARTLMDGPSEAWRTLVLHPDHGVPMFLLEVAERLVYHADELPDAVVETLPSLRSLAGTLRGADLEEVLSLGLLAEGVARRAQGDHLSALACYAQAEALIAERPTSLVYARLSVQRAFSLRALRQVAAARAELVLAGQVFSRLGVNGNGVVLWELANLAWQEGQPRRALGLARQASAAFTEEGDAHQARMALHTAASALISLRRGRAAARLLDRLEAEMGPGSYERALVSWKRGKISALLGDGPEGLHKLAEAAELLAETSPLAAAEALVDRAVLAGELGAVDEQLDSASRAVALLSRTPAHVGELSLAIDELKKALATQGAVTELLLRLRRAL